MAVRGQAGLSLKVIAFVVIAFAAIFLLSRADFGADDAMIGDMKKQLADLEQEHKNVAKGLADRVNKLNKELGRGTEDPANIIRGVAKAAAAASTKPAAAAVPAGKKTKQPIATKKTIGLVEVVTTAAPSVNDGPAEAPEAPEGSPESNNVPEDARTDDERKFKHWIGELKPLPEDASDEMKQVFKAFSKYNEDRESKKNIPVYGTACIGEVDCPYVKDQLKSLDTGVGHVVVVLNRDHKEFLTFFRAFEAQFPGRFTLAYRPEGGGCSESWNIMLRLGFSITPQPNFVMATNGDLWALPGNLEKFAKFMNDNLDKHVGSRFVHFSSFALNKRGWEILGPFDESIYPAYAEDVEYHIRAVSKGVFIGSYPDSHQDRTFKHAGSRSFADKKFNEMYGRWDKNDYMFRKWNVDMRMYSDYQHCNPHKHPWGLSGLTHRKSWVVDPGHRKCIRTGEGIRHNAHAGGCFLSACNSCWYNASVLLSLLPPGTKLPDGITTQNRVRY